MQRNIHPIPMHCNWIDFLDRTSSKRWKLQSRACQVYDNQSCCTFSILILQAIFIYFCFEIVYNPFLFNHQRCIYIYINGYTGLCTYSIGYYICWNKQYLLGWWIYLFENEFIINMYASYLTLYMLYPLKHWLLLIYLNNLIALFHWRGTWLLVPSIVLLKCTNNQDKNCLIHYIGTPLCFYREKAQMWKFVYALVITLMDGNLW